MDKKVQTRGTQKLAPAHSRIDVDLCRYLPELLGCGVDICSRCKITLDLLAPGGHPGLFDLSVRFFPIVTEELYQDPEYDSRKTLSVCFPGMAQLPIGDIYDRVGYHIEEIHPHTKTAFRYPLYGDWWEFRALKLPLLLAYLPEQDNSTRILRYLLAS